VAVDAALMNLMKNENFHVTVYSGAADCMFVVCDVMFGTLYSPS